MAANDHAQVSRSNSGSIEPQILKLPPQATDEGNVPDKYDKYPVIHSASAIPVENINILFGESDSEVVHCQCDCLLYGYLPVVFPFPYYSRSNIPSLFQSRQFGLSPAAVNI